MNVFKRVAVWALVAGMGAASVVSAASLSARVWFAKYEFEYGGPDETEKVDGGTSPMYMLQLDGALGERVSGSLMLGVGTGWDKFIDDVKKDFGPGVEVDGGATRVDALAGLSWQFDHFYLGGAAHFLGVNHEVKVPGLVNVDWDYYYAGPEILIGGALPLMENRLLVRGSLSALPVVLWVLDDKTDTYSGVTWGYSVDAGVVWAPGQWRLGAGYRVFNIAKYDVEGDVEDEWGNKIGEFSVERSDEFGGFYVMGGFSW